MTILPDASSLITIAQQTRASASKLALLPTDAKNQALEAVAQALELAKGTITQANIADCQAAAAEGIAKPLYKRLQLNEHKLRDAIAGVRDVRKLPDPVGQVQIHRELDTGLVLKRITCPLGVLGIIFEARPEAAIQIVSLAIKSGNGVILKGGKEAIRSCEAIVKAIKAGLSQTAVDSDAVQLLTTREETLELLKLDKYVDLIIPRGSNSFVQFVQDNTRIPVLGHADGICHLYIDEAADLAKAITVTVDAKIQYAAACNAIETLLIHQSIAKEFLPKIAAALQDVNVELKGDERTLEILPHISKATFTDWKTEYSDLILAIKIVDSIAEAIAHINEYGSRHTDAIITEDLTSVETFFGLVNAAGVFHNCSTRFADGFRYGFGAEVGISTQQMPPRGPVGLEGLVTYKYQMTGNGHIVATYTGANAKSFTHQDLESIQPENPPATSTVVN
ncbi:glutamate-5-semialdehyde dehydrogenase [Umezakia ovalisporum]|uniref:glutamate-5-semialdehyde dehydrogenase n=1 Tax=Umezakia ovalisporum TaxID=75695 RepID=UPI0006F0B0DF|nr:glutamate-5-semialdehyde dehydrogenase [Umezakia ovalisporum]MBI1243198.1 glutamate-5-semialdehyde dehydrogenase [Nostoc sp. RI_552]MDH6087189.1 glutamate-5-semialdehyde dehydrogenase [Umezakia ovalisporum Ak1311]CEJ48190.1 Gamma-glutamyl phosphate reductase (GPR) (EC 1.2. 1.41) (Glutamate-5-semialdehyde dehydrogenase) (Glutamyl-ga mma-semialdehyde dehydrogenase) (GSA dehydrogenase) [Umezakia ovalisporum]